MASIVSTVHQLYILLAGKILLRVITITKWLTRERAAVSERASLVMAMITNILITTRKTILVEKTPKIVQKTMKRLQK